MKSWCSTGRRRIVRGVHQGLASLWYGDSRLVLLLLPLLLPFSWVFRLIVIVRRAAYAAGLFAVSRLPVPVIVVGNITVGGAGKTPLVIWLSHYLREQGYRPGIVCRGYGGRAASWPQQVTAHSDPRAVGDEAILLAMRTACPVAAAPARARAARALVRQRQCDIILCDDGLQHYALHRDIEIAVIDGQRRLGNGHGLPAGPLREPLGRLARCDLIVARDKASGIMPDEFVMCYQAAALLPLAPLASLNDKPPRSLVDLGELRGQSVHAVAGIANPHGFITRLRQAGLAVRPQLFPDHHAYRPADFGFAAAGDVIVMTEKDAVKCRRLALQNAWYLPIQAVLPAAFAERLTCLLKRING